MSLLDKPGEPSSAASAAPSQQSIPLYIVNGVATVWDAQAAATLHCAHDISGLRAGTLPGVVQQNGFLGLPITLMPEEATHLVNKGIAHLVPLKTTITAPPATVVAERTAARVARSRLLAERMRADEAARAAEGRAKHMAKSAAAAEKNAAKRADRTRKRAEAARTAAITAGQNEAEAQAVYHAVLAAAAEKESKPADDTPVETPAPAVVTADNTNLFTVVPALPVSSSLLPTTPTTLSSPAFPFPAAPGKPLHVRDAAIAQTFSALHARGLRMGLGPRFGGEWLVYPGDYLRYHAHFTSQVILRDTPIRPAELVAWGRLGTGTKKAGLICCWDDGVRSEDPMAPVEGVGEVEFYSLEWANFG